MALQSPLTTMQAASPTSAIAEGLLPDAAVAPDASLTAPAPHTDNADCGSAVFRNSARPVDVGLLHASMACAADDPDFAADVKDEVVVAADADGCAAGIASCDSGFEDVAFDAAGDAAMFAQTGAGDAIESGLPSATAAAAALAAPCVLASDPVVTPVSHAPATASLAVAAAESGQAEAVGASPLATGAGGHHP